MPICSDPNARVYFWLDVDKAKPIETRPTFVCRPLTHRQRGEHSELVKEAYKEADDAQCYVKLMAAIRFGVLDWLNMPVPFSEDAMFEYMATQELWELANGYPRASRLSEDDRKKLTSSSPVASAGSAEPVAAGSVETSPPK